MMASCHDRTWCLRCGRPGGAASGARRLPPVAGIVEGAAVAGARTRRGGGRSMAARSNEGRGASGWELDGMGGVFDLLGTVASGTVTALSSGVDLVRRKPLLGAVLAGAVVGGGAGI